MGLGAWSIARPLICASAQNDVVARPAPCEVCLDFSSSISRPIALGQRAVESRVGYELSAVQISGLPGNDRPLTHTVTLRAAGSCILARWRHSTSSQRAVQRMTYPRPLRCFPQAQRPNDTPFAEYFQPAGPARFPCTRSESAVKRCPVPSPRNRLRGCRARRTTR